MVLDVPHPARRLLAATALLALASGCAPRAESSVADRVAAADSVVDLSSLLAGTAPLDATFLLVRASTGARVVHGPQRTSERFRPASTFKIANTLIALETGVATGTDFFLPWDSLASPTARASWARDQTLESAFRNSVYWYYQELARRIGAERMRSWLGHLDYGNRSTGGGIDRFWLSGDLRISPDEQVRFLQTLVRGELPVSPESRSIVIDLMRQRDTAGYRIFGKTGTSDVTATRENGWLVGWVEAAADTSFYALNMEGETVWEDWPPHRRVELLERVLTRLRIIGQQIDTLRLGAHARILSADSMGGRASGTPGLRAAQRYIVSRLESLRIEGFAPGGGYLQPIPLTAVDVSASGTRLIVRRRDAAADTITPPGFYHLGGSRASFAPFAGQLAYGGTTQEALGGRTQLVRDSMVLVVHPDPQVPLDSLLGTLDTGRVRGVIAIVPNPRMYERLRVVRGPTRFIAPAGAGLQSMPVLVVPPDVALRLGIDSTTASGAALPATAALEMQARFAPSEAANIIARIPGSNPGARAVMYLAHYDHIGIGEPEDGDSLYNGFIDNAVGVAAVLGVAEAMRTNPPAGPVIFLLTAAEEEGSLGSAFFAANPPLPLDSVAAAINLDAGAPLAPPRRWRLEGGSAHTVWQVADSVARSRGWEASLVPALANSDHWSLLSAGVPSVLLAPDDGWEGVTPEQEQALIDRWWRAHRPGDEWSPAFPLAGLGRYAEFALLLGYGISSAAIEH
jgi:beta-lactamase class D